MDYEAAKHELLFQAGLLEAEKRSDGFLESLRPYSSFNDTNFHAVMEALLSVGARFHAEPVIERDLVEAVWGLCRTARLYGLEANSVLVANSLISPEDAQRLRSWIDIIEGTMIRLLRGLSPHESIHAYSEYVMKYGWGVNHAFFVPWIGAAIADPELGDQLEAHALALAALGPSANSALDTLQNALRREYAWYEPTDRCTREMRVYLQAAIDAVWM